MGFIELTGKTGSIHIRASQVHAVTDLSRSEWTQGKSRVYVAGLDPNGFMIKEDVKTVLDLVGRHQG